MSVVPIDVGPARAAVDTVSSQVAELLRSIPDTSVPVPTLDWTAGETGAHLVNVATWFNDYISGRKKPPGTTADIASFNAERIANFPERDGTRLATHLREAVEGFLTITSGHRPEDPFPWFDDRPIDVAGGTCILLGELIIHGFDLARAADRSWPIDPDHARLVLTGMLAVFPRYVDRDRSRGVRVSYEIRVKGSPPFYLRFTDGELTVTATPSGPVDCRITADPVDYLLLSYGRIGQLKPILRGKLIAWGRKPWLGPKMRHLVLDP